jgi:hypothetical protein
MFKTQLENQVVRETKQEVENKHLLEDVDQAINEIQ